LPAPLLMLMLADMAAAVGGACCVGLIAIRSLGGDAPWKNIGITAHLWR
jgi:hypothetical protein